MWLCELLKGMKAWEDKATTLQVPLPYLRYLVIWVRNSSYPTFTNKVICRLRKILSCYCGAFEYECRIIKYQLETGYREQKWSKSPVTLRECFHYLLPAPGLVQHKSIVWLWSFEVPSKVTFIEMLWQCHIYWYYSTDRM